MADFDRPSLFDIDLELGGLACLSRCYLYFIWFFIVATIVGTVVLLLYLNTLSP